MSDHKASKLHSPRSSKRQVDPGDESGVVFGVHPVQEALRSGSAFERLYISEGRRGDAVKEILHDAKARGIDVRFEPYERLTARAGRQAAHQGVVGILAAYAYHEFDDLLTGLAQKNAPAFLLLLDQIQDPHNLGAILRSAECAGVHGVAIPKHNAVGVTPSVIKVAAGATAHLPVCRVTNLATAMDTLKERGVWMVGASSAAPQPYHRLDLTMPLALVIGNEEKGLRRLVAEKCDFVVSIPLYGKIASLNASVASAILMFEVCRQRSANACM